ncbi:MAG: PstS family phosphate ABC transporter substrate-binding protein [Opitutales bacterium]
MKALLRIFLLIGAVTAVAIAAEPPPAPPSGETAAHLLRVAGYPELGPLLLRWQEGFRRTHPGVRFENHLTGSDTGMARLYTGQADLVLLGREAAPNEIKAFEWIYQYRPFPVDILTGSLDRAGRSPALVFFVHPDNPLSRLTLVQADALFSPERRRGAPAELRTWGQLGLTGEWADRPVHLYVCDTESNTGCYFRKTVLKDSRHLYWDRLQESADTRPLDHPTHDAAAKIRAALAADRDGLAVASLAPGADASVKALALAADEAGVAVSATEATLRDRSYPLARPVYAYVNQAPGTPVPPLAAEFLRYLLGKEGRSAVQPDDGYLSLTPEQARVQSAKLQ